MNINNTPDTCKKFRRGDAWYFDLDSSNKGSTSLMAKTRLAVVISSDEFNSNPHNVPIIIPLTKQDFPEENFGIGVDITSSSNGIISKPNFNALQSVNPAFSKVFKATLTDGKMKEIDEVLLKVLGCSYLVDENKAELEMLRDEVKTLRANQVIINQILPEAEIISSLQKEVESLKDKLAEANNTIAYRDKQIKKFSTVPSVDILASDYKCGPGRQVAMIKQPSKASIAIAKDYITNVKTIAATKSEEKETVEPIVEETIPTVESEIAVTIAPPIKATKLYSKGGTGLPIARKWSTNECTVFLKDADEMTLKEAMDKYTIYSPGTYYNIIKLCKEKVSALSLTPKIAKNWSVKQCKTFLMILQI